MAAGGELEPLGLRREFGDETIRDRLKSFDHIKNQFYRIKYRFLPDIG